MISLLFFSINGDYSDTCISIILKAVSQEKLAISFSRLQNPCLFRVTHHDGPVGTIDWKSSGQAKAMFQCSVQVFLSYRFDLRSVITLNDKLIRPCCDLTVRTVLPHLKQNLKHFFLRNILIDSCLTFRTNEALRLGFKFYRFLCIMSYRLQSWLWNVMVFNSLS